MEKGNSEGALRKVVPRYQRRTGGVDEALLGVYLSGTNGRRIRSALAPLLKGAPLSKDAVSRLTGVWRTIPPRGAAAIWPTSRSGICFSTAGIRESGSGNSACGCRGW